MCLFSFDRRQFPSAAPLRVEGTQIFARGLDDGRQALVYSMRYSSEVDVAMILPLPTPATPPEDAVRFVDLSGYARFFDDLERGFPALPREDYRVLRLSVQDSPPVPRTLSVHDVGSFEASFVPTASDFARLDARFRLPAGVLELLPDYRDYAFAVFKLKPGSSHVHPMAFTFPRRNRTELFFPTVHVHDGTVPDHAAFDHALYCQLRSDAGAPGWNPSYTWQQGDDAAFEEWLQRYAARQGRTAASYGDDEMRLIRGINYRRGYLQVPANAAQFMDRGRAMGLVQEAAPVWRLQVHGMQPNQDILVAA